MVKSETGLEFSSKAMRSMVSAAMDEIAPYLENIEDIPIKDVKGIAAFKKMFREPLPEKGISLEKLLKIVFKDCVPKGVQVRSPGYLAYIPVGTVFPSVVAELVSFSINRWPALYHFAPGFVEMENSVLRWLGDMMGLPKSSGGILTSGGSLANLSAIVAARHKVMGEEFSLGTLYFSSHAHHSIEKSARIVGIAKKNLRFVKTDRNFRLSIDDLRSQIRSDLAKGLKPFLIVGTAGTTGTGAIDPLPAIAEVCREHQAWFHVDAAWAGSFRLTSVGKKLMRGTELADSITIDPHKALYTPFGCGALLVRDPSPLRDAHSFEAAYLPGENEEETLMSSSKLSPELSRGLRGLQVWLPIKQLGIAPFRKAIEEKIKLTQWITKELKKISDVEIVFEPETAIVGFRYFNAKKTQSELNELNRRLLDEINSDGRILLSSIELNGDFTIRIIPFGQKTHFKHVKVTKLLIEKGLKKISAN